MKKYKLLRYGRTYVNAVGDMIVKIIGGSKKTGYVVDVNYKHPTILINRIKIFSRVVPNDGSWIELTSAPMYCIIDSSRTVIKYI